MTHLWVRAESRRNEDRVGITPDGVADLIREGFAVTVEESRRRVLPIRDYADAGARIAPEVRSRARNSSTWPRRTRTVMTAAASK